MSIQNTGVVVHEDHRRIALERARGAVDTPVIIVGGVELSSVAREDFGSWLDRLAMAYGLPEPPRDSDGDVIHYGMTMQGEFTRWAADPDTCPPQDVLGR